MISLLQLYKNAKSIERVRNNIKNIKDLNTQENEKLK